MIYKKKKIYFSPMNMVIKGTASAIKRALSAEGISEFDYDPSQTYNPDHADEKDKGIKTAKLIFTKTIYTNSHDFPFASYRDIKFIVLGDGGTEYQSDGTYAVFKDFGSEKVDFCNRFTPVCIHMEEFDNEEGHEIVEKVRCSFLTQSWSYGYLDYSCGEYGCFKYPFAEKDAWENDDKHQAICEAEQSVGKPPKAKKKSDTVKQDAKVICIKPEVFPAPEINIGDYVFDYTKIEQLPRSFYEPVLSCDGGLISVEDCRMDIDGFCVNVDVQTQMKELAQLYDAPDGIWYDPQESSRRHFEGTDSCEFEPKDSEKLSDEVVRHRTAAFARLCQLCMDKAVVQKILKEYPHKKNGTLYKKRVLRIAWLYALDWKKEKSEITEAEFYAGHIYQLYAAAQSDKELLIAVRFYRVADDRVLTDNADLAVWTNLFNNL